LPGIRPPAAATNQRVDAIARDLTTDDWNHPLATLHQRSARSYRHQYAWIIDDQGPTGVGGSQGQSMTMVIGFLNRRLVDQPQVRGNQGGGQQQFEQEVVVERISDRFAHLIAGQPTNFSPGQPPAYRTNDMLGALGGPPDLWLQLS
jgi:hypothetical protein